MPQPGWYADPDGTPERLRWWDGTRWADSVHGGPGTSGGGSPRGRGPWSWVALALTAALVVAVGFGVGAGLWGRGAVLGTAGTPAASSSPADPEPGTQTTGPTLPPVSPQEQTTPPVWTPAPMPSIPSVAPEPADDGCPEATSESTLTDGHVSVTIPETWVAVDGLAWLACSQAATSPEQAASVVLGRATFPASGLQDAAEHAWTIALLDAAVPHPLTRASTPVTVAGLDGWMVTGTISLRDELDELTVIVVDTGDESPSVLVTLAGTHDLPARDAVTAVLATVQRA